MKQSILSCLFAGLVLFTSFFAAPVMAETKVVGGTVVEAGDVLARSTVALYLIGYDGKGGICTGTIVSPSAIITAGHCIRDVKNAVILFARNVTEQNINNIPKTHIREVTWFKSYRGYSPDSPENMNDLASIKFAGGLPAGYSYVTLASKAKMDQLLKVGTDVVIAGYGKTRGEATDTGVLRKTSLRVKAFMGNGNSEVILDGGGTRASCQGDSGGPAFVQSEGRYYLWGVTSRGSPGCTGISVYTKIQAFIGGAPQATL